MIFCILWLALLPVTTLLSVLQVILLYGAFLFKDGKNNHSQCHVSAERCPSDASERVLTQLWGTPLHLEGAKPTPSSRDQPGACPCQACRLLTFPQRRRRWEKPLDPPPDTPGHLHAVLFLLDVAWGWARKPVGGALHICDHYPYWAETFPCGCLELFMFPSVTSCSMSNPDKLTDPQVELWENHTQACC